jgi:hypothetical protein
MIMTSVEYGGPNFEHMSILIPSLGIRRFPVYASWQAIDSIGIYRSSDERGFYMVRRKGVIV